MGSLRRSVLAALSALATSAIASAGPPGDECETAFDVTTGVVFGDTSDAGGVNDDTSCASGDVVDEWYVLTAPSAGVVTATTCGSGTDFDTTLALYTLKLGCFDTIELDCNDDFCGLQSLVSADVAAAEDVYIRVSGWSGATGAYELFISFEPATCASCTPVTEGVYVGSTLDNPAGPDETGCTFDDTVDEWFCYTASCTGEATVETCGGSTDFDTSLAVFSSCGGDEITCNDDFCGLQSTVTFPTVLGETYFIRLSGFNGAAGTFEMSIACAAAGDECETCIPIDEGTVAGSTLDNTGVDDDASCGFGIIDEWYCFTPSCSGTAIASVCESDFAPGLAVFDACDGNEIACTKGCELEWPVVAGVTYFIRVAGLFGGSGNFLLQTTCPSDPDWFFDDPVEFASEIAAGGYTAVLTETFEDAMVLPGGNIIDDPLDETTDNDVFEPGDIASGVTFQSHVFGGDLSPPTPFGAAAMFVAPEGVLGVPDVTVGTIASLDHGFDLILDPPLPALGLSLFSTKADGFVEVRLFTPGMTLIAETAVQLDGFVGFIGAILDETALAGEPGVGVARIYNADFMGSFGGLEGISEIEGFGLIACPGDANADGVVDVVDLVAVITAWGVCGERCQGDVTGDGLVSVEDLVAVITSWGPCGE